MRDDEHARGARVTLERDGVTAPWSITCGVYGWMAHTCFYAERAAADRAFEAIKRRLEDVLDAPDEAATSSEIERFVRDHP